MTIIQFAEEFSEKPSLQSLYALSAAIRIQTMSDWGWFGA
jgi:hypothetical protein